MYQLLSLSPPSLPPSHVVLFYFLQIRAQFLKRQRLQDMMPRVNTLPLGCGALAGHAFGIDREFLREKLGFSGVSLNSMVRVRESSVRLSDLVCDFKRCFSSKRLLTPLCVLMGCPVFG